MGLRFVGSRHRIRKQTLILVYRAYIVPPRNAKRIKRRSTLRARVEKARDLGLVGIVQIRKRSTGPDHAVRGKLIGDACIPGIAQPVCDRRNHREVCRFRAAGDGRRRCQIWLVEYVGAFLEAVPRAERYVRAQAVLEVDRRILVRLVQAGFSLIEGEPRRVGQRQVQSRRRLIQRDERRHRITHIAHRLRLARPR